MEKKKRQINSGLKAWNDARSFFSKENKKAGKKFSGIELNALTKSFLFEHYGKSFDKEDLDVFIKKEVPNFYDNIFDVTLNDLMAIAYFLIDDRISNYMPKNVTILVDAGELGVSEFNSSEYNYYESGVKDIVENIRDVVGNDSETIQFEGSIEKRKRTPKDSKNPDDYYIKWTLEGYGTEPKRKVVPQITEKRFLPPIELAKSRKTKKRVSKKVKEKVKKRQETRDVFKENKQLKERLKEKEKEIEKTSQQVSQMQQQMLEMQQQMLEMQKQLAKLNKKK